MTSLQAFNEHISRLQRHRLFRLAGIGAVAFIAQAGWFLLIGRHLAERLGAGNMGLAGWLAALPAAAAGTCVYLRMIYRPLPAELIAADRRLGLRDCLSTAFAYGRDRPEHAYTPLLIEDARRQFDKHSRRLRRLPFNHRPGWIAVYGLAVLVVHVAVAFAPVSVWRPPTLAEKDAVHLRSGGRADQGAENALPSTENDGERPGVQPGSAGARDTADRQTDLQPPAEDDGLQQKNELPRAGQALRAASSAPSQASDLPPADAGALSARLSDVLDARLPDNGQTVALDNTPPGDEVREDGAAPENGEGESEELEEAAAGDKHPDELDYNPRTGRRAGRGVDGDDVGAGGEAENRNGDAEGQTQDAGDSIPGDGQGAGTAPGRHGTVHRELPTSPQGRAIPGVSAEESAGEEAAGVRTTARAVTAAGQASRLPAPIDREYRRAFEAALTRGRVPQAYRPYVRHYFLTLDEIVKSSSKSQDAAGER